VHSDTPPGGILPPRPAGWNFEDLQDDEKTPPQDRILQAG
jgi:hypothetical protein